MSDKFRLAGLLRFRRLQEDQAAAELGRANGETARARAQARNAALALGSHSIDGTVAVTAWHAALAGRAALRTDMDVATALVASAARVAAEREAEWKAARARSLPLEKLEERHAERVAEQELAADQIVIDEAASRVRPPEDVASATREPGGQRGASTPS